MKRSKLFPLLAVVFIWSAADRAEAQNDTSFFRITVSSVPAGCVVLIDSQVVGKTPLIGFGINQGLRSICVVPLESREWNRAPVWFSIKALAGAETTLTVSFPRRIHVTSVPYGATVRMRDSVLGQTPLFFSPEGENGILTLDMVGFQQTLTAFDSSTFHLHEVLKEGPEHRGNEAMYLSNSERINFVPIAITASSAIVTGVAAAYFKLRADQLYKDYRQNGDPATLDRVRQLDLSAGISLVASEISIAFLAYLLLSQ